MPSRLYACASIIFIRYPVGSGTQKLIKKTLDNLETLEYKTAWNQIRKKRRDDFVNYEASHRMQNDILQAGKRNDRFYMVFCEGMSSARNGKPLRNVPRTPDIFTSELTNFCCICIYVRKQASKCSQSGRHSLRSLLSSELVLKAGEARMASAEGERQSTAELTVLILGCVIPCNSWLLNARIELQQMHSSIRSEQAASLIYVYMYLCIYVLTGWGPWNRKLPGTTQIKNRKGETVMPNMKLHIAG